MHPRKFGLILAAGCVIVAVLGGTPAGAHAIYREAVTSLTDRMCVSGRSEVSHGRSDHGYSRGDVETGDRSTYSDCEAPADPEQGTQPYYVNYFAWDHGIALVIKYYKASTGQWYECFRSRFAERQGGAYKSRADLYWNYGCGYGWYATWTWAGAKASDTDSWHGGWIYSGNQYIKAVSAATVAGGTLLDDLLSLAVPPPPPADGEPPTWDPSVDVWSGADAGVIARSAASGGDNLVLLPSPQEPCIALQPYGVHQSDLCPDPEIGTIPPSGAE